MYYFSETTFGMAYNVVACMHENTYFFTCMTHIKTISVIKTKKIYVQ